MSQNYLVFESYNDATYIKEYYNQESDGFLVIHRKHGEGEIEANKMIGLMLAKHGYRVVLKANQPSVRSADATLNDKIWEFKTISDAKNLSNRVQGNIKNGKKQAANILIFINQLYNANDITKGIYNAIKFDKDEAAQKMAILFQSGKLIIIERAEVLDKSYRKKF